MLFRVFFKRSIKQLSLLALPLVMMSCASGLSSGNAADSDSDLDYGVLVMAHGGGAQWNAAVEEAVMILENHYPVAVAFGMADAGNLERAVRKLEDAGVEHVGVVRLFISGESWYERTQQILGNQAGAPDKATAMARQAGRPAMAMPMGFWEIESDLQFHLSEEGLADAEEMDAVLLSRIQTLSTDPDNEVVAVLAHGPGDDAEDQRWIAKISARTQLAKAQLGLADVQVFTLREDWEEKRIEAEQRIRHYVETANANNHEVIVVPYRVMGFGPYHEVLDGLDYRADETGLVPHANVDQWILNQATELRQEAMKHQRELLASSAT